MKPPPKIIKPDTDLNKTVDAVLALVNERALDSYLTVVVEAHYPRIKKIIKRVEEDKGLKP